MNTEEFNKKNNDINLEVKKLDSEGKKAVIDFKGYIDTYNSPNVGKFIAEFVEENEVTSIVYNLGGLSYISSTGIGFLTESLKICNKHKIKFYLSNIQKNVLEVINLLGFTTFFNVINDIEDTNNMTVEESKFPVTISCSKCNKPLKIVKIGKFKCGACGNIIKVNKDGIVE
jgi:anti-anti-sigma factor